MTTDEMIDAVEAWVIEACPDLSSFDYAPEELDAALPMVLAEPKTDQQEDAEAQLPGLAQYEQTILRTWAVDLLVMVKPDPPEAASHALYGYTDAIGLALRQAPRLGDMVILSQFYQASYDPPEVEYADGTVARQVTIRVTVGEMIGVSK